MGNNERIEIKNKDPSSGLIIYEASCNDNEINKCNRDVHRCTRGELPQKDKKNNQLRKFDMYNKTGNSPFSLALGAARLITNPEADTTELKKHMGGMDEQTRINLVFRIRDEVMDGQIEIAALFVVAKLAKMHRVAYDTLAVNSAMIEGNLRLEDLGKLGLAEARLRTNPKGKRIPYIVYRFNHDTLKKAANLLRGSEWNKPEAARVLEKRIRQQEARNLLRNVIVNTSSNKKAPSKRDTDATTV